MAALHCRCPIARDYTLRRSYLPSICRLLAIAHISLRAMASPSLQPGGAGNSASCILPSPSLSRVDEQSPESRAAPTSLEQSTIRYHAEFFNSFSFSSPRALGNAWRDNSYPSSPQTPHVSSAYQRLRPFPSLPRLEPPQFHTIQIASTPRIAR